MTSLEPIDRSDGSDRSRGIALAIGAVLGWVGGHRYYVGKIGTGVLQTLTFGGLGLWWTYDMILIAAGGFRDGKGRRVKYWTEAEGDLGRERALAGRVPDDVLDELDALRDEVTDLTERMDFAERMLAGSREQQRLDRERSTPV